MAVEIAYSTAETFDSADPGLGHDTSLTLSARVLRRLGKDPAGHGQ